MRNPSASVSERRLFDIAFTVSGADAAIRLIYQAMDRRSAHVFAFCNMHTVNLARRSNRFREALSQCTVFNDGLGVDVASWVLQGTLFTTNLNGTDLTAAMLASLQRPISLFIVGGLPGVAEKAALALTRTYPLARVVGTNHGYFGHEHHAELFDAIRDAQPDVVLVGMGNPRQEYWAMEAAAATGSVMICVGAYIDFVADRFPRAPGWVRSLRCEWLHRLVLEPRRLAARYCLGGATFAYAILIEKLATLRRGSPIHQPLLKERAKETYNSPDL